MIKFIDTAATVPYSVEADKDEQKTVFRISAVSSGEMQLINDATVITESNGRTGTNRIKTSLRNRLAVYLGLKGWDNAGKPFESEKRSILGLPDRDVIKESLLNSLPTDYINDLGEKIQEISLSGGIDQKN